MRHHYAPPVHLLMALRAVMDLGVARLSLRRIKPQDVVRLNARVAAQIRHHEHGAPQAKACAEASYFIGRMAMRVPWRSDCLVQALAGQRWLARRGLCSEIVIGAAKRADGSLDAHAWLRQGGRIVLGGDISTFQPLLDPDEELFERG